MENRAVSGSCYGVGMGQGRAVKRKGTRVFGRTALFWVLFVGAVTHIHTCTEIHIYTQSQRRCVLIQKLELRVTE